MALLFRPAGMDAAPPMVIAALPLVLVGQAVAVLIQPVDLGAGLLL